jgi:hypothetical protein
VTKFLDKIRVEQRKDLVLDDSCGFLGFVAVVERMQRDPLEEFLGRSRNGPEILRIDRVFITQRTSVDARNKNDRRGISGHNFLPKTFRSETE